MKINENFLKIQSSYLFSNIAKKVAAYQSANPDADIIRLGIGDTTRPLADAVIKSMHKAVDEMADEKTYQGYQPDYGQNFVLEKIQEYDFKARGVDIDLDEIFLSDGAKSDSGNIGDIFSADNVVAICDPVYPVYIDTNVMAGRTGELLENGLWSNIVYLPCTAENNFLPELPKKHADIIYLCFPNNPTGMAITADELQKWVGYANENGSVILYDAAYEAFITEDLPHSIYELKGAKTCAIELRSFSKTAGFTGVRCGYTVVPKELVVNGVSLNKLWARRQSTKFNGVSYITQRAAEATYSPEGRQQVKDIIAYYQENAKIMLEGINKAGFKTWGGVNSPYVWLKTPDDMKSWDFFDLLLNKIQVVGTPGEGFGPSGEGFFRLTAFGSTERTKQAIERIQNFF
ncbi:MAG: LL-diaminopimelate aminotransferase [Clostridiales bacterium]|nr:LL-diaminopimelate aminotransferase [Clostridiales bacterium]